MSKRTARHQPETELAQKWWQLPLQAILPLNDGQRCLLIYPGLAGGSTGPDGRDAVLAFLPSIRAPKETLPGDQPSDLAASLQQKPPLSPLQTSSEKLSGDIEFHTYASDWFTHRHHCDPRYNRVILHVVLYPDSQTPTKRADGTIIPVCSLLDPYQEPEQLHLWSCQERPLTGQATTITLLAAGLLRLQEKSERLQQRLEETQSANIPLDPYDRCLLPALAEALGYGRDPAFFRAAGLRLAGLPGQIPEPLGHTLSPASIDARRLSILARWHADWQETGIWQTILPVLQSERGVKSILSALRALFRPLNHARTDIIVCNVVLPFAAAVAYQEQNIRLAAQVQSIYLAYPGLVSNRVTRMISAQLQLPDEPAQACLQQGLHYIYTHTCQVKDCQDCLCGGKRL